MDSRLNPHAGEFGRHWDPSTGIHQWDGANLDFDVWAYAGPDALVTVVVQQMPPEELQPADPVLWTTCMRADGSVMWLATHASVEPTVPRVPFEAIPEPCQATTWEAATKFRLPDGGTLRYADGRWTPAQP